MVSKVLSGTSRPFPKYVQQLIEDAQTLPALVRSVDRAIVEELLGQGVPRTAAVLAIEDGVQHTAWIDSLPPHVPWRVVGLQQRADLLPGLIRQPRDRWAPLLPANIVRHGGTSSRCCLFYLASRRR